MSFGTWILKRSFAVSGLLCFCIAYFCIPEAHAETWKIITLDWPPYTDEHLADKGVGAKALSEALKTVGVEVEFIFMPWARGAYEVKKEQYVGIFPSWTEYIFVGAKLSPPIFQSPIGFAYHRLTPHPWKTVREFKGLSMGIVQDYNYPGELVRLGEKGVYSLHTVSTDEQNLFKVAYKRIDVTVVDLVNARFLVSNRNPALKELVTIDPKVYQSANLYLALKDDAKFKARQEKLKQALRNVSAQKIVDKGIKEIIK
jgi:polar amino acid transport system substrate-binding protein